VASVYALNALSFVAVIGALLLMRNLPPARVLGREAINVRALVEGLRFVFGRPVIRSTMLLDGIATFFCSATALLPLFAQDVLHVGPQGYGWLYAAPSIGAVLSSAVMVRLVGGISRRGPVLIGAVTAYGVATVVFGLSRTFWMMFLALAVTGAADTISGVLRNIVRQLETPDRLRGRMVGISMLFFMGGPQLGEFESGVAAQVLGAGTAVVLGGMASLVSTGWIAWRTPTLRAYRRG
jgi:MFS family permease